MPWVLFSFPVMADVASGSELVSGLGLFLNASARGQRQLPTKSRRGKLDLRIERQL